MVCRVWVHLSALATDAADTFAATAAVRVAFSATSPGWLAVMDFISPLVALNDLVLAPVSRFTTIVAVGIICSGSETGSYLRLTDSA